ncbi:MAG TPA: serine/threonine-protein kinase [Acidobacteriaceae bacterium]|jgi:non-specific serine/threonine protein kinase/serine/threonine-protein kinase|nr:serine/threonine-protein kinase [Acidobacteriaceae bacterium]
MEADRWQRIEGIYHAAMQCPPQERGLLLADACAGDPSLLVEVESLLRYGERSSPLFERPAIEVVAQALADDLLAREAANPSGRIGERIAQYRIVGKLGTGGMGDVYRAVRADDEYEKEVAIKLVRQGMDTGSVEARFRRERQILAGFEHENIARLIDGGTTEEGCPYFVMELIEGKPIDEYCDAAMLGIAARIDLFRGVCSAVEYAHQRLVVHRDIKPGNILVTAEGIPKLLDFGIATILSPDTFSLDPDLTETGLRVMTPQFASPEQIHGKLITTASDVYSLGVVLYRLLTGFMPYRVETSSSYELARAVCDLEPEKPSSVLRRGGATAPKQSTSKPQSVRPATNGPLSNEQPRNGISNAASEAVDLLCACRGATQEKLRRTLSGDLDQIILKALRKEPDRRYTSAREFAEDLRSYLRGLPVAARGDTLGYRTGKFVRRNKFTLAALAVFVLLALAGVAVILRESRRARVQEERAERRFNDVRSLANSLLFEIHDSISDLPGSTAARKLLVERALHYLDSLSQESANAPGLERELATAYERVGDVQGNPHLANLGDTTGAIASYRKALHLRLAIGGDTSSSFEDRAALARTYMHLGLGMEAAGNFAASMDALQQAFPIAQALVIERPSDLQTRERLAGVYFLAAGTLADMGDLTGSIDDYRKSAALREAINDGPREFQTQVKTRLAGVYGYMAGDFRELEDLDSSIALEGKAHDILVRLAAVDPQSARLRQFLLENEYWTGFYNGEKGLQAQALVHFRRALAGYRKLSHDDAHDVLARRYLGKCYVGIGAALTASGKPDEGAENARRALQIFDSLAAGDHGDNFFKPVDLAYARLALADAYVRLARTPGIADAARKENWQQARNWYQRSQDVWMSIQHRATLGRFDTLQSKQIVHRIAACDDALAKLEASGS